MARAEARSAIEDNGGRTRLRLGVGYTLRDEPLDEQHCLASIDLKPLLLQHWCVADRAQEDGYLCGTAIPKLQWRGRGGQDSRAVAHCADFVSDAWMVQIRRGSSVVVYAGREPRRKEHVSTDRV